MLFYKPEFFLHNPEEILKIWRGGMSFHGGMLGVLVAIGLFARRRGVSYFTVADIVGAATPIGLCLGRIANFINGELYGRVTDAERVPWAMVFPEAGPLPRHPSQLYEALTEGAILFLVLYVLIRRGALECTGLVSGCLSHRLWHRAHRLGVLPAARCALWSSSCPGSPWARSCPSP